MWFFVRSLYLLFLWFFFLLLAAGKSHTAHIFSILDFVLFRSLEHYPKNGLIHRTSDTHTWRKQAKLDIYFIFYGIFFLWFALFLILSFYLSYDFLLPFFIFFFGNFSYFNPFSSLFGRIIFKKNHIFLGKFITSLLSLGCAIISSER